MIYFISFYILKEELILFQLCQSTILTFRIKYKQYPNFIKPHIVHFIITTLIKMQVQHESSFKKPQFRFPYQQCKTHFQKLNYICLNKQCYENSLICSQCKESQKHNKHEIRPLKFYLEELEEKYKKRTNDSDYQNMLEQLELSQYQFYQKLKKAVQNVAEQFRKVQQEVTNQISKIRNQLLEQISKRHKFNQFYQSLKKGNIDNSNFLIQNYLPQPSVGKLGNLQSLQVISLQLCQKIQQIKNDIISRKSTSLLSPMKNDKNSKIFIPLNLQSIIKKPTNVAFYNGILNQTANNLSKSLCFIQHPVSTLTGKLIFKIVQFKKGHPIYLGAMTKQVYTTMGQHWQPEKMAKNCFAIGSDTYKSGWQSSQILQFGQGSCLQVHCKDGLFKITQKNKCSFTKLPKDVQIFIFIVLTGQSQVKITHVK